MKKIGALFLILAFLSSCTSVKKEGDVPLSDGTLYFNLMTDPDSLDPAICTEHNGNQIITNLFEGLTNIDPVNLDPLPGVAESWEVSPDAKVYTFHLRNNAKWSDDSPVTADDFVYAWRRVVDPKTGSNYAYLLHPVKNASNISSGKIQDLSQLGVTAPDKATLRVELERSTPYFLSLTSFHTLKPVKKEVVEKWGAQWTRPENIVSNGFFNLEGWTPGKEVVLVTNPHYWDKANVYLKKVVFAFVEDEETALKQFLSGHFHFIDRVHTLKIPLLKSNPEFRDQPMLATYMLMLNTSHKPLDNKLVRQALAHAIDRERIVSVLHKGHATTSLAPKGVLGYQPPPGPEFNPEKARKLLAEAGFSDPKTFPPITISYNTSASHKPVMEMVQSMWKENLGIDVKIQNMEWKVLLKTYEAGSYDVGRYTWVADYADPSNFLELFLEKSGNNDTRWASRQYDELLNQASMTLDQQKRLGILHQAETLILEELLTIPLYTLTEPVMISSKVKGLYPNPQDLHPLKGVTIASQ